MLESLTLLLHSNPPTTNELLLDSPLPFLLHEHIISFSPIDIFDSPNFWISLTSFLRVLGSIKSLQPILLAIVGYHLGIEWAATVKDMSKRAAKGDKIIKLSGMIDLVKKKKLAEKRF